MTTNNAVNNLDNFIGFSAFLSADMTSVTGNSAEVTMIYDTVLLQKDVNYNNTNGVFTCNNPGLYEFISVIHYQIQVDSGPPYANQTMQSRIRVFHNDVLSQFYNSCFNCAPAQNFDNNFQPTYIINKSGPILLEFGDTVYSTVFGDGSASNNIDIIYSLGDFPPLPIPKVCTFFTGYKVGNI